MLHVPAGTKNDGAHKVIMTLGASSCGFASYCEPWLKKVNTKVVSIGANQAYKRTTPTQELCEKECFCFAVKYVQTVWLNPAG